MNTFFNSIEYISLLESSMINGNKSATMYKMMSKSRNVLGEIQGILKREVVSKSNKITDNVVKMLLDDKKLSIKEALFLCNSTYYDFKTYFSKEERERIYEARNSNKLNNINQ